MSVAESVASEEQGWQEFAARGGDGRFTEWLRLQAGSLWDSVVEHRFTDELADGSLDQGVLRRYLIQDHCFLDAFVVLLSSTIAHMRCLEDRLPCCQFLALITGTENTYFEDSFKVLGVMEKDRLDIPDEPVAVAFCDLMRSAAYSGELPRMLAVLVVAEWSYNSWGERVLPKAKPDLSPLYRGWIDLHVGESLAGVVDYLRRLLDKEGPELTPAGRSQCLKVFLEAVQLEKDFFDMAYQ